MPELPDIEAYVHALRPRVIGRSIRSVRTPSPFIVRTFEPPVEAVCGKPIMAVTRLGKRIVLQAGDELFVVIHLMIAGRLQWKDNPAATGAGKITQAVFHFESGTLVVTEASHKKRASIHVERGAAALAAHDPGGLEPLAATTTAAAFAGALRASNHTIKRALTDPSTISGIGNAFSDEILHAARLSPLALTGKMTDGEYERLFAATQAVLRRFTTLLCERFAVKFPGAGEITAFRPEFAAHGKFGEPCPVCGQKIARIVRTDNEMNYCPTCQTGGKLLADRSMSRLLGDAWGDEPTP